jgi:hypothetical protein
VRRRCYANLLPNWVVQSGFALGLVAALSILALLHEAGAYFLPATRFGGFAWFVATGFALARFPPTHTAAEER